MKKKKNLTDWPYLAQSVWGQTNYYFFWPKAKYNK